jgi:hypothetical protein
MLLALEQAQHTTTDALTYPCETSEKKILQEFEDLFPADIPAVSDVRIQARITA